MNLSSDSLRQFTPAIVYTLYDGYYIYSRFENTENTTTDYEYGIKPYIYYTCRYVDSISNTDCIINYTLDNAITVYGTVRGTYVSPRSGFLINPASIDADTVNKINTGNENAIINIYIGGTNNVQIKEENLTETIITLDGNNNPIRGTYQYTYYNNQKIYRDTDGRYFRYSNYKKVYVTATDVDTLNYAARTIGKNRSAIEYYIDAYKFSTWVENNIGHLTMNMAVDEEGNKIEFTTDNTEDKKIFDFDDTENNPEKTESIFNSNRVVVIRHSIETSLIAAVANFNEYININYEYRLPVLLQEDWDKITNEVCVLTFLQGIPIKSKFFNDYCVISNNQNKEFVSKSSILLLGSDGNYHKPNCKSIVDSYATGGTTPPITIEGAYTNLSIARQTVKATTENVYYFLPHNRLATGLPYYNCYDCIVNIADVYDLNQLIDGDIKMILDENGNDVTDQNRTLYGASKLKEVRSAYFTALAREKYDLYKSLSY